MSLYKIYTIITMKKVLEYLLTDKLAQIPRRENKEMKSIVIDDKKIRFNKDKPKSKVLQKKLVSIKNTNEYRSYALNKTKDTLSDGRVRNLLTKHAVRNTFREKNAKSAFKNYANNITLENKHFEGERGLEMIANQKNKLRDF